MRQLIHDRAGDIDLERHARTLSPSILQDGKDKVLDGLTTVEEVLRVYRSY
jgi:general secretion pathway protein E